MLRARHQVPRAQSRAGICRTGSDLKLLAWGLGLGGGFEASSALGTAIQVERPVQGIQDPARLLPFSTRSEGVVASPSWSRSNPPHPGGNG